MGAETFGLPLEPKAETKCFESCRSGQNRFRFGFASVGFVSVENVFFFCFSFPVFVQFRHPVSRCPSLTPLARCGLQRRQARCGLPNEIPVARQRHHCKAPTFLSMMTPIETKLLSLLEEFLVSFIVRIRVHRNHRYCPSSEWKEL